MKIQEQLAGVHILSLIGQQGSGKTTLGQLLSGRLNAEHIEASEVVRDLRGNLQRSEMHTTNDRTKDDPTWLGDAIATRIDSFKVILTGVREVEVHRTLEQLGTTVTPIILTAPTQERYKRLLDNKKVTSYGEFTKDGQAELDIGLSLLLEGPYPSVMTTHYTEEETAQLILDFLKMKNNPLCS